MLTQAPTGAHPAADRTRTRFALVLALAALLLTAPRLWLHELWRDEAWLWLVAIESDSLKALFLELSRSGQGYLFPLLAWVAAHVSASPLALQALNLAIVVAGVYVLGRFAPLRRLECTLLAFGYYCSYEYAVLSRHYALGMALVFVACAAARARRPILLGVTLGLLCQTTVYGVVLALGVAVGACLLQTQRRRHGEPALASRDVAWALLAGLVGLSAGIVQLVPASGTSFAVGWRFYADAALALETLQVPWRALLPLPRPQLEAWNSDLLVAYPGWRALAGATLLAIAAWILWPRKRGLLVFALGAAGLLAFGYVKYVGTMRHHGHLWLLFVVALWLAGGIANASGRRSRREWVLLALLAVHVGANVFVSAMDLRHPFSNGARAAAMLRERGYDRLPLLGYREPPAASVSLALGLPMYAPSRDRYATHTDWGPLQRDLSLEQLRCAARALAQRQRSDVMLVMNAPLPEWPEIAPAGTVTGAMVASENYHLYRLARDALPGSSSAAACEATNAP